MYKIFFLSISAIIFCTISFPALSNDKWSLSNRGLSYAKKADNRANRVRWGEAQIYAAKTGNKLIKDMFLWRQFIAISKYNTFEKITKFIKSHQDWPEQELLKRRAENVLNSNTPQKEIVKWFTPPPTPPTSGGGERWPITAKGKRFLAESLIALGKERSNRQKIHRLLQEVWVERDFTAKEEYLFLTEHSKKLRVKDYIDRIDRLLWEGKIISAKRILHTVNKDYQNLFNTRIKLRTHKFGLDKSIAAIPKRFQNNSGLLYDRIKWRERFNKTNGVPELILRSNIDHNHAKEWWKIRRKYINKLMREHKFRTAYTIAKEHDFSAKENLAGFAEAEWLAGWISLRFLKDPKSSYRHFARIYRRVKTPISRGRASYWAGRASESNLNFNIAKKWYGAASEYFTSFYGQLAKERLSEMTGKKITFRIPEDPLIFRSDINSYRNNKLVEAAYIFYRLGRHAFAKKFLKHAVKNAKTSGERLLIAGFGKEMNRLDYGIIVSKEISSERILHHLYPTISKKVQNAKLINAIVKQESMFNTHAKSHTGALGLMQLMPATAKETARKMKLRYNKKLLTSDPNYNITLGNKYLTDLIKRFNGSYILAIAAYNGGARNVRRWIKANGDPRKFSTIEEIVDWIELIPFKETRNYVQRVMENMEVYGTVP